MYITIGFSGPAGAGVNTAGLFLGEILASHGYSIRADKEYASIIKGGNNSFFLSISDAGEIKLSRKVDMFIAFDEYAVTKNQEIYELGTVINIKGVQAKYINMFALGVCLRMTNIGIEDGKSIIKKYIKQLYRNDNITDLKSGFDYGEKVCSGEKCATVNLSQKIGSPKRLMFGNELLTESAVKSGLEFYAAYPMTPVTSVIEEILKHPQVTYFQGEDEIAVAMAMLGARFAGKRAMCATSGGGFALMSESISFSMQSEIGGVYILGQRDGPSTGTPTYTSQGDLYSAVYSGFGETSPIVIAPSTFEELYHFMSLALNWSDQYQHPLILLIDKQLAEGYKTIKNIDLKLAPINRGERLSSPKTSDTYLRYKVTQNGISPYAIPGNENTLFIATSYEHDEAGATNEDPKIKDEQVQKRFRKRLTFYRKEYEQEQTAYEIINPQAENFFITRGINRYNIEALIKDKPNRGIIVIKIFYPVDYRIVEFFQRRENQIKKVVFVEMNYEGQLERGIRHNCGLRTPERDAKITHFRKYTLYPIFIEELEPFLD